MSEQTKDLLTERTGEDVARHDAAAAQYARQEGGYAPRAYTPGDLYNAYSRGIALGWYEAMGRSQPALASLLAERDALREALEEIAGTVVYAPEGGHEEVAECVRIARAALASRL